MYMTGDLDNCHIGGRGVDSGSGKICKIALFELSPAFLFLRIDRDWIADTLFLIPFDDTGVNS